MLQGFLYKWLKLLLLLKKTKTNKYINQLIFILNSNNPVLKEIIIKNILKVIGWVTESIIWINIIIMRRYIKYIII